MIKGWTLAADVRRRQIQTDGATSDQTPDCLPTARSCPALAGTREGDPGRDVMQAVRLSGRGNGQLIFHEASEGEQGKKKERRRRRIWAG